MDNIIAVVVIAVIVGLAAFYVYRAKKSGRKCIGCPYGDSCAKSAQGCGWGCGGDAGKK